MALILAGCGGRFHRAPVSEPMVRPAETARGPIRTACLQSTRERKSSRLCGCIQSVADQTLTHAQQRRSVAFYSNPHLAQDVRQSDRGSDERFWEAYSDYAERAEGICA